MADGLWLRFGPVAAGRCGRVGTQNLPDKHKACWRRCAPAMPNRGAKAIREDVIQGMEQVRQALEAEASARLIRLTDGI